MFTGIVRDRGVVRSVKRRRGEAVLAIRTGLDLREVSIGDSIAVDGVCLTVTAKGEGEFSADCSVETLSRSTLGDLRPGDRVNLETALRLTDFLGGHLVLGHVDAVGVVAEKTRSASSIVLGFSVPGDLDRYIVEKGSVTVDGISLTVNRCERGRFWVNMIPHTAQATTLGEKKVGDGVNIETDIIAKYVEKLLTYGTDRGQKINLNFLAEHGFLR